MGFYQGMNLLLSLLPMGALYVMAQPCTPEEVVADLNGLKEKVNELTRHIMLMSHQDRERIMAEGTSGIVKVRDYSVGNSNYFFASHFDRGFANIHDHANYEKVYGLGDFIAVMNGVQFRTRHNDFELRKASTTSKEWLATEPIELPPLPPGLEDLPIENQTLEMREYIKAFKLQDPSIRPYKDYFKPVLCYLEGWWAANTTGIENGFESLRLKFNAKSWEDMTEKARADAYLGSDFSIRHEDGSLPVTILGVEEETGEPIYAQWNYRILCHPLKNDLPTAVFKPVEDFAYRRRRGLFDTESENLYMYKGTRYVMDNSHLETPETSTVLDSLVEKIPGMDNRPTAIAEDDLNRADTGNMGYYNRAYNTKKDGMSSTHQLRGYSDGNMFVAMTTQENVAPLLVKQCISRSTCAESRIRATWMLPIEVLYVTPLQRWNPYNLEHTEGGDWNDYAKGATGKSADTAYLGSFDRNYYRIPKDLFDRTSPKDKATSDAYSNERWMKNGAGDVANLLASGPRTLLPNIEGIGETRLRYPIAPVHEEGTGAYKELNGFIDYLEDGFESLAKMADEA